MATWDKGAAGAQRKVQYARLKEQMRDGVAPFSPFWRERFKALKLKGAQIDSLDDLRKLPAVGERDICPDGDPRGAAGLVIQADETGFALHAPGTELRAAMLRRLFSRGSYRRQVEAALRPTTYHWAGRTLRFPIASTRADHDVMARAGARAYAVLGLTGADVVVAAVPVEPTLTHTFLTYAGIGAGIPTLFPGAAAEQVAAALDLVPATVLVAPGADAARLVNDLGGAGANLAALRRLVLLSPATIADRSEATAALRLNGASQAQVLALYGPGEGRVLWAECAPESGFHTYPDLDLVEVLDAESGLPSSAGGELIVTQLGFRGSALVRWRTGDVVDGPLTTAACPTCGRTVPRIPPSVRAAASVPRLAMRGRERGFVDLRAVTGALAGRADLAEWFVDTVRSTRDGSDQLMVYIAPRGDAADAAAGAYRDIRSGAGVAPTQIVVEDAADVALRRARAGSAARS